MKSRRSEREPRDVPRVRVYRLLLWLYPRSFRRRFGDELTAAVREELIAPGRGAGDTVTRCARLALDLGCSALRLHLQQIAEDLHRARADLRSVSRLAFRPASRLGRIPPFPPLIGGLLMSAPYARPTANDRFKQSFSATLWTSVLLATVAHSALLNFFPELEAEVRSSDEDAIPEVVIPEAPLPEPPAPIQKPKKPIVSERMRDVVITIDWNTDIGDYEPVYTPPVIPAAAEPDAPSFTPYDLAPRMKNHSEVQRALTREYPPLLRDAGIGDTVVVWLYIDENGEVQRFQVHNPSAHQSLNQAALRVVGVAEFSPAMNRDKHVAVWVQFPVTFQVR